MATRAPPPKPEEYTKYSTSAQPPPERTSTSRATPPVAQPPSGSRPIPNMADIENDRMASPIPHPPSVPKPKVHDLDSLAEPQGFSVKKKLIEYRAAVVRCQKSQHALERAIICSIAVALLWLTCLALCQAIVNTFIISPTADEVIEAGQQSIENTQNDKALYDQCAQRMTSECELRFEFGFTSENAQVALNQGKNKQLLDKFYKLRDQCQFQLNQGLQILNFLQANGVVDPKTTFQTAISFTDSRCNLVDDQLKGGNGGIQALGSSSRYVATSDNTAEQALTSFDARASYDSEYIKNKSSGIGFIANITLGGLLNNTASYFTDLNKTYETFLACNSPSKTYHGRVCPTESVLSEAAALQERAKQKYNTLVAQANSYKATAEAKVNQIQGFYTNLKNNAALFAALNVLLNVQGTSFEAMGFSAVTDITLGSLSLDAFVEENMDAIFAQYQGSAELYANNLAAQAQYNAQRQAELRAKQLGLPTTYPFPPYNPPPVNTSVQRQEWYSQSGPFIAEMGGSLDGALNKGEDNTKFFVSAVNGSFNGTANSNIIANIQQRNMEFYVYEDFTIEDIKNAWEALISTALSFDYIFRAFHTIQIIKKYWRVSAIDTPPADVRTDLMQDKGLAVDNRNVGQKLFAFLAHPGVQCLVITGISLGIFALFLRIYYPIFSDYVKGCVVGDQYGNGTVISRNANSLSYAFARSDGDKTTSTVVDHLNVVRDLECQTKVDSSQKVFNDDNAERDFLVRQHKNLQVQAFALNDCINITKVQQFNTSMASLATKGNITDIRQALPGSGCDLEFEPLFPAVFNCSNIVCENIICDGPNAQQIKFLSWQASCYAEWYLHAQLLGSGMVIIVYISLNLSRIFTLRGIVRLFWRYLTDGRFAYLGTCDRLGELKYPSIITERGYSMKKAVRESLAVRITRWERRSMGIFLFGLGINIPWIVVLAILNADLPVRTQEFT